MFFYLMVTHPRFYIKYIFDGPQAKLTQNNSISPHHRMEFDKFIYQLYVLMGTYIKES